MKILAAAAAAFLSTTAAQAATTTIDFTAGGDVTAGVGTQTVTFGKGRFTGTATAMANCDFICSPVISQDGTGGIGVSAYENVRFIGSDDPAIDGVLLGESIEFAFDRAVRLVSIVFGAFDDEDDVDLTFGGTFVDEHGQPTYDFPVGTFVSAFSVGADDIFEATGCAFHIGDHCVLPSGGPDDVFVQSLSVAPVPLPAAGWMLVAGVGGIAALGRRRR